MRDFTTTVYEFGVLNIRLGLEYKIFMDGYIDDTRSKFNFDVDGEVNTMHYGDYTLNCCNYRMSFSERVARALLHHP